MYLNLQATTQDVIKRRLYITFNKVFLLDGITMKPRSLHDFFMFILSKVSKFIYYEKTDLRETVFNIYSRIPFHMITGLSKKSCLFTTTLIF